MVEQKFAFDALFNFRCVEGTKLYRSGRPDKMTSADVANLLLLGISCVVDLRSIREFPTATGEKIIDEHYSLYQVSSKKIGENIEFQRIDPAGQKLTSEGASPPDDSTYRRHYIFDIVSSEYVYGVKRRANWYQRILLYLFMVVDYFFGTFLYYKSLVKFIVNNFGLIGQYKDVVDMCKRNICTVLRVMAEADNAPALVCCAYGKDRTGIICALVLCCLGKSKHFIAEDYAKSASEMMKMERRDGYWKTLQMNSSFYTADYDTMITLLEYIEHSYGSVDKYLDEIGIDCREREKLCQNFQC